jgi:ATP-binding cassette, subfamily B, bacterial
MKLNTKRTLRYYWQHVTRHKWLALLIFAMASFGTSLDLVVPYFYKLFFDNLTLEVGIDFIVDKNIQILYWILGVYFAQWVFWRIANFSLAHFEARVKADLANECFDYMHGHSYRFFTNHFVGSLIKKVGRFNLAFEVFADKFYYDFLSIFIKTIVIFVVLFWLHPVIGIAMLIWTVLFTGFNYWFSIFKLKYDIQRAQMDTRVSGALADSLTNNANVKYFAAATFESSKFAKVTHEWFLKNRFAWNLSQIAESIQVLLMFALEFFVFYFAMLLWKDGILTIGDFVWIQAYIFKLFMKLWDFGRIIRDVYENMANAEEMVEILSQRHEIRDAKGAKPLVATRGKVEFKKVCFWYSTKATEVIHGMNFKIKPGEKVALVGPSGGGKSTITKLLMRLFDVKKGAVLIDGQDVKKTTQTSVRAAIAFVPQDPIMFHRTVMENIRYGRRDASDDEVFFSAKLANCHQFISKFPKGYKTYVGERGIKLSGGERQRVAIARAILANAPILVLDEATSSLDSESEALIQEALENLMKNKTTVVIAHRLSTIMKMDRILVLQDGKIVEEGAHADLVSQESGLYKRLWDLQVGGYVAD